MKPNISKVNLVMAKQALINAKSDRKKAYSQYIILHFHATGNLAPGIDNKDLQAYYDKYLEESEV